MTKYNFQDLLNAANSSFNNFSNNEVSRLSSSDEELYSALANIVAVRHLYSLYPIEYGCFLTERNVLVKAKQLDKAHPFVRALMPENLREQFRSKISLYGQVVDIIVNLNIDYSNVIEWLKTPEDVKGDGKSVSGLLKALAFKNPINGKKSKPKPQKPESKTANDNATPRFIIIDEPVDLATQLAFGSELYACSKDETGKLTFIKVNTTSDQLLAAIMAASEATAIAA